MRRLLMVVPLLLGCDRVRPPAKVATPAVPAPTVAVVRDTTPPAVVTPPPPAPDTSVVQAGAPADSGVAVRADSTVVAPPESATVAVRRPELLPPARLPALAPPPENEPMEFDDESVPVLPFVQHGECEGESCARSIVAYSCLATTLLADPDDDAKVVARIPEGEFVQARRDLVLRAIGVVVVKEDFQLYWDEGRDGIVARADTVDLAEGDTVYVLRAQDRGRWTWAYHGRLHESGEFWATTTRSGAKRMESDFAVRRSSPTREQWWQVTRLDGTTGWWLQSVNGAKAREEQYDELQSVPRMQRDRDDCTRVKARKRR
jgi:hypothetical protein